VRVREISIPVEEEAVDEVEAGARDVTVPKKKERKIKEPKTERHARTPIRRQDLSTWWRSNLAQW